MHGVQSGILAFCWHTTSPATATIQAVRAYMQNEAHGVWQPLAGVGGWAPPLLHATCLTMLQLAGHIFMWLVEPFQAWPYAMGRLVHASVPEAIRRETAAALWEANECCTTPSDGWTDPLRRLLRGAEEALSEPWCQTLLRDLFERIPASTILVEDALGRGE